MKKRCSRCREWLDVTAFGPNRARKDGLQNNCRKCQQAYTREHYEANTAYYIAKAKRSNAKRYPELKLQLKALKDVPCADCGKRYPSWVMDFDHVFGPKLFEMGRSVVGSMKAMLSEAAKCEVVCANCHRDRTQRRRMRP